MRCQKCGFTNSPTARFCKQCGTPFAPDAATPPAQPQPAAHAAAHAAAPDALPCPQCTTPRANGKRFCRQCRFDFSTLDAGGGQLADATPGAVAQAEEQARAVAEAARLEAAVRDAAQRAEQERESERLAAQAQAAEKQRAAEQRAVEEKRPADLEPCPRCSTPRVADKRFCRSCRYDFVKPDSNEVAQEAPIVDGNPDKLPDEPLAGSPITPADDVRQPHAVSPRQQDKPGINKAVLIGVAAVVVVGIAVGTGLFIRSQHSAHADDQAVDAGASSATFAAASDVSTAAATPSLTAAASEPAGSVAASGPANVVDSAAASLPAVDATPIPAQPAPPPSPAQAAMQPPADNQSTAIQPPDANANPQHDLAASLNAPSAHPKPHKPVASPSTTATDGANQNSTIRAAIAGSLSDGNSCFGNKKFDCAISNADAVLRLDPHNGQALALRHRAKSAQDSALNSLSIQ